MVYFVASGCSLPTGLNLDAFSGEISGTIAAGADTGSPYSVAVTAMDEVTGANATQTFNWTVNAVTVSLTNPGDQTNYDGDAVTLDLSASENASHSLTYSVTSGALPPGLSLDPSTGAITGTISSTADTGSPYSVTVDAADAITGTDDPQSFNWTVSAVTVSLTSPGDQTNNDADAVGFYLSATDSAGHTLVYTVDSTNVLPPGLSLDPGSGRIYGVISATADTDSPYTVTLTATDAATGASDSQTFTWTVNPADPADGDTVTTPENQAYTFAVGDFGIVSGDGNTAVQVVSLPTGGTLTDNGSAVTVNQQVSVSDITGGLLVYTPDHDAYGTGYDNFDYALVQGGCVGGDPDLEIDVTFVNQKPSFTAANPVPTFGGAQVTIDNWATFNPGASNESGQTATYYVINIGDQNFFSVAPAVSPSGQLTYSLAQMDDGSATFSVYVQDNGGTFNGGCDTSPVQNFTVVIQNTSPIMVNTPADNANVIVQNGEQIVSFRAAMRLAVLAASGRATIGFAPAAGNTINIGSPLQVVMNNCKITINGPTPGSSIGVTIQRNSSNNFGIFDVGAGGELDLNDLSVVNGAGGSGSGINNSGIVSLVDVSVRGNNGTGAAIYNAAGANLVLWECYVTGNTGGGFGGGISNFGVAFVQDYTQIFGNQARQGGGIYNGPRGELTVDLGSTVQNNGATDRGGGISNWGILAMSNAFITDNSATNEGGGLYNGAPTISDFPPASATLTEVEINGNNRVTGVNGRGGGIYIRTGVVDLVSGCSVVGNTASLAGGGNGVCLWLGGLIYSPGEVTDDIVDDPTK